MTTKILAQQAVPLGTLSPGNVGIQPGNNPLVPLASLVSTTVGVITIIGIIYFLFVLITGAIGMINSEGDKGNFENARRKLTTGVVGVIILVAGLFIMQLTTQILGLPNFLDLQAMLLLIRQ